MDFSNYFGGCRTAALRCGYVVISYPDLHNAIIACAPAPWKRQLQVTEAEIERSGVQIKAVYKALQQSCQEQEGLACLLQKRTSEWKSKWLQVGELSTWNNVLLKRKATTFEGC